MEEPKLPWWQNPKIIIPAFGTAVELMKLILALVG